MLKKREFIESLLSELNKQVKAQIEKIQSDGSDHDALRKLMRSKTLTVEQERKNAAKELWRIIKYRENYTYKFHQDCKNEKMKIIG